MLWLTMLKDHPRHKINKICEMLKKLQVAMHFAKVSKAHLNLLNFNFLTL